MSNTLYLIASDIFLSFLFKMMETVAMDTPASLAICLIVVFILPPVKLNVLHVSIPIIESTGQNFNGYL